MSIVMLGIDLGKSSRSVVGLDKIGGWQCDGTASSPSVAFERPHLGTPSIPSQRISRATHLPPVPATTSS